MFKRVLITGADGFIGSHLTELMVREGYNVRAMVYYNSFDSRGWLDTIDSDISSNIEVIPQPCDGETFAPTASASIDLVLAVNVLFFLPLVKQWSYMFEMARVLKPGGFAIFNVHLADGNAKSLRNSLDAQFPKRAYGLLAPHCIASSFPDKEFEQFPRRHWIKSAYYIIRKRGS